MKVDNLKSRLATWAPLIFIAGQPGLLRVLEKSGRVLYEASPRQPVDEERIVARLHSLLQDSANSALQPAVKLSIHVAQEAISVKDAGAALAALAAVFRPEPKAQITLHLNEPAWDWSAIHALVKSVHERLDQPHQVGFQLTAPFGEFHKAQMEALFDLGVRFRFAAGWIAGGRPGRIPGVNSAVLREFSEAGFRTTIEWYVHAQNMRQFEEQIADLLVANFCSGFSLPLVSQNPGFRFEPGFPVLPEALEYCRFLMRVYAQYPFYDDVFFPLTNLAMLIKEGGWHSQLNIPAIIHLSLDGEGRVGFFRQSPALTIPWTTAAEVATMAAAPLRRRFLESAVEVWQWKNVPYCSGCDWRYICGGADAPGATRLAERALDAMCGHRKLFLEHFARLRGADCVVDSG